ncbi:DNA-binding response regulator [Vreelandella aquamarina]|uniref:response regulator n=1 Tax=Vreelandella aquamarina TaxID=77097 RepID=UPI00384E2AA6
MADITQPTQRDTVLVVDDSPESLNLIIDALASAGVTVLVALDGRSALGMLDEVTPDIILMDAIMPGIDGFETCRLLKKRHDLPVIFMTGLSETEHIVRGMEVGGVDYITKPVTPDELLARMRVHLTNARRTSSAKAALDASGRHMLAVNALGAVLWSTPQASHLLEECLIENVLVAHGELLTLPEWLSCCLQAKVGPAVSVTNADARVEAQLIGQLAEDEYLLSLSRKRDVPPEQLLSERLGLTQRQAEVLYWIANGKSNKDIALILDMSPRTVNKHLEQVFLKLGVENRTSAAVIGLNSMD